MKTEKTDSMFCVFAHGSEISDGLLTYGEQPHMKDENGVDRRVVIRQIEPFFAKSDCRDFTDAQFICEYTWA